MATYHGNGGMLLIDDVEVQNLVSWSIDEQQSDIDKANATETSVDIDVRFHESEAEHILPVGQRVELKIRPSGSELVEFRIIRALLLSRSITATEGDIISASISFQSRYSTEYS